MEDQGHPWEAGDKDDEMQVSVIEVEEVDPLSMQSTRSDDIMRRFFGQIELTDCSKPLSSTHLKEEFGVMIVPAEGGSNAVYFGSKGDYLLQFVTKEPITEAVLQAHGILKTSELTGSRDSVNRNYLSYLKSHDIHIVTNITPAERSYTAYFQGQTFVAHASDLTDLQTKIEEANLERKAAPPDKLSITAMPNGKVSVSFPDSSEVILDKNNNVYSWRDAQGNEFKQITAGPPPQWKGGNELMKGAPRFSKGNFTFDFHESESRITAKSNGNGTLVVELRPGEFPSHESAKLTYEKGELAQFEDPRGKIIFHANTVTLVSAEGTVQEEFTNENGNWSNNGRPLEDSVAVAFHQRLARMYQRTNNFQDALTQHELALERLERSSNPNVQAQLRSYHQVLVTLAEAAKNEAAAQRHERAIEEIIRITNYNRDRTAAVDSIGRSHVIFSHLPEQVKVTATEQSLSLRSNDFQKLLEAVPGFRVPDGTSLKALRSVSFDGARLKCEGEATLMLENPNGGPPIKVSIKDLTAEVRSDSTSPGAVQLTNIDGLVVTLPPFDPIHLKDMSISVKGSGAGRSLEIKLNRIECPTNPLAAVYIPKDPQSIPLSDEATGAVLNNVIANLLKNLEKRSDGKSNLKGFVPDVTGMFSEGVVAELFKNANSIEKDGEQICISTAGEMHQLGGLPIAFEKSVTGKVKQLDGSGQAEISDIHGASLNLDLPSELVEAVGLTNPARIEKISFSRVTDENRTRTATIHLEGTLSSAELKIGPDMKPICDKDGNFTVTFNSTNGVKFNLVLNAEQLQKGLSPEKLDFEFSSSIPITVPGYGNFLKQVTDLRKSGDVVSFSSPGFATNVGGVPLSFSKAVTARLVSKGNSYELSNIEGASLALPIPADVAASLGLKEFCQGPLRDIMLSEPDKDGNRFVTIRTDVLESSRLTFKVDANLHPIPINESGDISVQLEVGKSNRKVAIDIVFNPNEATAGAQEMDFKVMAATGSLATVADVLLEGKLDPSLKEFLRGANSISKTGDHIQIENEAADSAAKRSLGGLPISFDKTISARRETVGAGFVLKDLQGVNLRLPLPPQFVEFTGLQNPLPIRELNLSEPDASGNRLAIARTDGKLQSVEIKVGPDMKPVVDGAGNIVASLKMDDGSRFELTLCEEQLRNPDAQKMHLRLTSDQPPAIANLHKSLGGLWNGIEAIEKNGEQIKLTLKEAAITTIGGLPLVTDKNLTLKLNVEGDRAEIKDMEGATLRMPLPPDLAEALGMHNPLELTLKNLSIGPADAKGYRLVVAKMDGVVGEVEVLVGPDMQPVQHADKNVVVNCVLRHNGQELPIELRFNPEQAAIGQDPRKIEFKLTTRSNFENVPTVVEGFFTKPLDPKLKELLRGVQYVERKGDMLFVHRNEASTHEIGGLKVTAAKVISFKINNDANGISLSNIEGLQINQLPKDANRVYSEKLPIDLKSFSLSSQRNDGTRVLKIEASGVLVSATVIVNSSLTPQDIEVEVQNPIQAFKEKYGSVDSAGRGTFKIHIRQDGSVDMGSLDLTAMLADAGTLTSTGGIVSGGAAIVTAPSDRKLEVGQKILENTFEAQSGSVLGGFMRR